MVAQVRYGNLHGKQYMIVPTVMLTEGVHAGSEGPFLYTGPEISKNPVVWNMKPVVVYHPMIEGKGVSACDANVLERQQIGMMLNTGYDGRLKTESWIDEGKADKVDTRVLIA